MTRTEHGSEGTVEGLMADVVAGHTKSQNSSVWVGNEMIRVARSGLSINEQGPATAPEAGRMRRNGLDSGSLRQDHCADECPEPVFPAPAGASGQA